MNLNYIVYPGNKTRFISDLLNSVKPYIKNNTSFIELFGGSGTMSLYMSSIVSQVIFNELDIQIYKIHYSFKNGTYKELEEVINEIWSYGKPGDIKEDYYKARDELNKKYFNIDSIKSGFFNWAISTFAINSMIRFGPNGFNQGWGNRGILRFKPTDIKKLENNNYLLDDFFEKDLKSLPTKMNEKKFNAIHNAYKNIQLFNEDYKKIKIEENSIIFVDPPYIDKGSGTYSFNQEEHIKFIKFIKNIKNPTLYTDVFSSSKLNLLGKNWDFFILRDNIGTGKPGLNSKQIEKEALYFNFKIPKAKSLFR